jgi:hypothetical protein
MLRNVGSIGFLAEIRQQLLDAPRDRGVAFELARPVSLACIVGKRELEATALSRLAAARRRASSQSESN